MLAALASFITIMVLRSVGPVVLLVVWALSAVYILAIALARAAGGKLSPPLRDTALAVYVNQELARDYEARKAATSARRDVADPAWWEREGFSFTAAVLAEAERPIERPAERPNIRVNIRLIGLGIRLIDGTYYCSTDVIRGGDGELIPMPAFGCPACAHAAVCNAEARRVASRLPPDIPD